MKIEQLTVQQKRLSAAEAELWIVVRVEQMGPAMQIRGSLTGPFCQNIQTIQIAYPLKRIRPTGFADNVLVGRFVIPEPNLWTVATPFVYEGNVELWNDDTVVDTKPIRAVFKSQAT